MASDYIHNFTPSAARLWAAIPGKNQKLLLSNVWCVKCRHDVTITNFSGAVKQGNLLLVGSCSECFGDVAKMVEMDSYRIDEPSMATMANCHP